MTERHAFWSPRLEPPALTARRFGQTDLFVPKVTPTTIVELAARLRDARAALVRRSTGSIVDSLVHTAGGYLDDTDPSALLAVELLPAVTGYSRAGVATGLRDCFEQWTHGGFRRWLLAELGDEQPVGPGLTLHVLAGNVPTAGLRGMAASLLVGSAALVKSSSREPMMPALFARSLARHDAELADAIGVVWWPGGDDAIERTAFAAVDVVEAFGDDASIEAIRRRLPAGRRLVAHGHKSSFAIVHGDAIGPEVAAALARDVAMHDQHGCLSPQAVYVLGDRDAAERFAEALAGAMADVNTTLPPGRRSAAEASAVHQARGRYEFRAGSRVRASPRSADWTVILTDADTGLEPVECRTVFVCAVSDSDKLATLLGPLGGRVQAVGLGPGVDAGMLGPGFRPWFAPLGEMQRPPLDWPEDGACLLRQLAGLDG